MQEMTHAGGVVARNDGTDGLRLLLVRSRDGQHWVLPKGHIEAGETPEQTAVREVREESGVVGGILEELGVDRYRADDAAAKTAGKTKVSEEVRALYFLMDFVEEVAADEDRALCWLPPEEAARAIEFEGSRLLVEEAAKRLRERRS